jgi:hypothetical protein
MGLKQGAVGNTIGEPIGNLKGTCWNKEKMKKSSSSPPPLTFKRKKIKAL